MDFAHTNDGSAMEQQEGWLESSGQSFCDGPVFNRLSLLKEDASEVSRDDKSDPLASTESATAEQTVMGILEALTRNGYCLMQTSQFEHMQKQVMYEADTADEWGDFVRPYVELETAYLGNESGSKVWWLTGDPDGSRSSELKDRTAVQQYMRHMNAIQDSLAFQLGIAFGCELEPGAGPRLLRRSCPDAREHRSLRRELLDETEPRSGAEVGFLDFIQRRRLCMMYVVDCSSGSFVELHPRDEDTSHGDVRLPLAAGQLLIFRHDVLAYSYKQASNDLVLQSWFMEESRSLQVNELLGSNDMITSALNARGSTVPSYQEVHITGLDYKLSGRVDCFDTLTIAIAMGVDGVTAIPEARWDHTPYYHPEGDFGKAWCKHSAFMDEEALHFDNAFFDMTHAEAASLYPLDLPNLEVTYKALHSAGFTTETLRNAPIGVWSSSCGYGGASFAWKIEKCVTSRFSMYHSTAMLISSQFHLKGVSQHIDTACSSSNVATNLAYQDLRLRRDASQYHTLGSSDGLTGGLVHADQFMDSPFPLIGMSSAKMVGRGGRARTYEMTADGMQRGEGIGAFLMSLWDSSMQAEQLAQIIGGAINQDGRSASLTAPSGPSQSKILKQGMKDCGRALEDITTTELHGTGTALGDPIETGSTRTVMINRVEAPPILHSSGKSNSNHQELAAGISGIMRQIMSMTTSTSPANQHIRTLNSNIDEVGYPALWPTERIHVNLEYLHNGVSSFGFGGTNARLHLWGRCRHGPNKAICAETREAGTVAYLGSSDMNKSPNWDPVNVFLVTCSQCLGTMCWTCGEATDENGIPETSFDSSEKHRCCMVRSETASYNHCSMCYKGEYILNPRKVQQAGDPFRKVYIVGSFLNGSAEYAQEMQLVDGLYVHTVFVGEYNSFVFNFMLDQDPSSTLYPVVPDAPQKARVLGPDSKAKGRTWLIEGRSDDLPAGGEYEVRFRWDSGGKSVSWERKQAFTYYIVSSWTNWKPRGLMENEEDPTLWETDFEIGESRREEFQFSYRDGRSWQDIYPNGQQVTDTSVQILGPDKKGHGKNWLVDGKRGEKVKIQLKVDNGFIAMSTYDEQMNTKTWTSDAQGTTQCFGKQFFIAGSWNGWKLTDRMQPVANGAYLWRFVADFDFDEEFQIIVDQNWTRVLHTPEKDVVLGHGDSCRAVGPDGAGHGRNWKIVGSAGATVDICLNLNLEQGNGIPMVSCQFTNVAD